MQRIHAFTGLWSLVIVVVAGGCSDEGSGSSFPASGGNGATGGAVVEGLGGSEETTSGGASSGGASSGGASSGGASSGGTDAPDANPLLLPESGFIEDLAGSGIMGPWYAFYSEGSSGTPVEGDPVGAVEGKICFAGTAAQVIDSDYSTYYGAAIGFDLCAVPEDPSFLPAPMNEWVAESKHLASECGVSLVNYAVTLEGPVVPSALRMIFKEQGRDESAYVTVTEGENRGAIADATVAYDSTAPAIDLTQLESIHFQIATNTTAATPFDFCITSLSLD